MESDLGCEKQRKLSGNEHFRAFAATRPLQSGKHPVALGNTNEVLRSFDSETRWVAAAIVSFAVIAALALAAQEWHQLATDRATEEKLAVDDGLLNANPNALSHVQSVNVESASSEMPSEQTISIDRTENVISPRQNPSLHMESQGPIQTPVSTLTFRGTSARR
jgi:hypothetical protein